MADAEYGETPFNNLEMTVVNVLNDYSIGPDMEGMNPNIYEILFNILLDEMPYEVANNGDPPAWIDEWIVDNVAHVGGVWTQGRFA